MKKNDKFKNKISRLSNEDKDKICDNCLESDVCEKAYLHVFLSHHCQEVFNNIKYELGIDYIDEDDE